MAGGAATQPRSARSPLADRGPSPGRGSPGPAGHERQPGCGVRLDDVRRRAPGVPRAGEALGHPERRPPDLHGVPGCRDASPPACTGRRLPGRPVHLAARAPAVERGTARIDVHAALGGHAADAATPERARSYEGGVWVAGGRARSDGGGACVPPGSGVHVRAKVPVGPRRCGCPARLAEVAEDQAPDGVAAYRGEEVDSPSAHHPHRGRGGVRGREPAPRAGPRSPGTRRAGYRRGRERAAAGCRHPDVRPRERRGG